MNWDSSAGFAGFGAGAVDFFEGLEADNSKAYWADNVELYRAHVRHPMERLLADLEPEFGPGFGAGRVFRPYRDVRFSADKSPYKTHCAAVIEPGRGGGAYYVEVSAAGMRIAGGCLHTEPDQLARFRAATDTALYGKRLHEHVAQLFRLGWSIEGDRLRSRPRGTSADHPRLELLRHRTLYAMCSWPPDDVLHEHACVARVRSAWQQLRPLNEWCAEHVGTSQRRRR